jgi:ribonuclease P protein component
VQTFAKTERLFLQREIDRVFDTGIAFTAYPLRVVYVAEKPASGAPFAILVSVPKKRFKRAVHRNRVKRLIRETYRLNKNLLWQSPTAAGKSLLIAFVYIGNRICDFPTMEEAMKKALAKLSRV